MDRERVILGLKVVGGEKKLKTKRVMRRPH